MRNCVITTDSIILSILGYWLMIREGFFTVSSKCLKLAVEGLVEYKANVSFYKEALILPFECNSKIVPPHA